VSTRLPRTLVWFSAGAASAVAALLTIAHGDDPTIVYVDPGSEHPDNERFLTDCEAAFGRPITRLKSDRYRDTWQVFEERRFLNSPAGALCTAELKKRVRFAFQLPDDVQVFGYTAEEVNRAERFREQNPGIELRTPLITSGLTKSDCLAMIDRMGIELPAMYKLGYRNNNCIGCVKGGMGYWNKIRRDFPRHVPSHGAPRKRYRRNRPESRRGSGVVGRTRPSPGQRGRRTALRVFAPLFAR
jgi:hypothetical protein